MIGSDITHVLRDISSALEQRTLARDEKGERMSRPRLSTIPELSIQYESVALTAPSR